MITLTAEITINNETIILDYRRITSINSSIFDRSDLSKPSYGIISNSGNMEFNDYDSKFLGFAHNGLLTADLPVRFFLTNTKTDKRKQIAEFETVSWDYDSDNKVASVSLKDDLEEWQDIMVDKIDYDVRKTNSVNLRVFYELLYSKTPSKYNILPFSELTPATQDVLENIYVNYKILYRGNLWHQWNKLCQVSQSHIYKTGDGKTAFVYKGGI